MDRVRSEISIELHELNTIYMLCSSIYNKIQYCLKGSQDIFEFSEFDKGHSLITHLANYKEIEELVYESHSGLVAEMGTDPSDAPGHDSGREPTSTRICGF